MGPVEPPVYLDHAATAPPLPEALEAFERAAREAFANPSSLHVAGAAAARVLERSRRELQQAFGAEGYRLVFTGTGTEGNHLGIQGLARRTASAARRAGGTPRVLAGALEHPSSLEAARALAKEGFLFEIVPVDGEGIVRPESLEPLLKADVALVTIQWGNNELGAIQPIPQLVRLVRRLAPHAAFHVDAVQAAGKIARPFDSLGADSIAAAAHKIGGLRGCAALFLRADGPLPEPQFLGGGHEGGLRSGTENVAGAAAFAAAAQVRAARLAADPERYRKVRRALWERLRARRTDLVLLGPQREEEYLGSILSFAVPGVPAEPLLHALETEGILAGSGSACKAHGGAAVSPTHAAIGLPQALRNSVLRFSFDGSEDPAILDRIAEAFARALRALAGAPTSRR